MELLQLRYFFESAKTESFAKTAQKYLVPTTSVSASVKRLEAELGCELFDRLPNKLLLNENGKKMLQSLYIVFDELDEVKHALKNISEDSPNIKMLVKAMRSHITDNIIEYKAKHPYVSFQTYFDFDANDAESYDIIVDDDLQKYPEYENFELCSRRILLKASKDMNLFNRKLSLKQLRNQQFISMGDKSSMHNILIDACKRAGFSPNIVVECNDIQCYRKCLESGIGIGYGRDDPEESSSNVRFLDVSDFNARQTVYGFYKTQGLTDTLQHFLDFLKSKYI